MTPRLSFSAWKDWHVCPAAAYASRVAKVYHPGMTEAMAVGRICEAAMTNPALDPAGALAALEPHERDVVTAYAGTQRQAPAKCVERAIAWGRQAAAFLPVKDELAGASLQTELHVSLGGTDWLCRLDVLTADRTTIREIKAVAGDPLHSRVWVDRQHGYGTPITEARYGYQLALYWLACEQAEIPVERVGLILVGKHVTRAGEAIPNVWMPVWSDVGQLEGYWREMERSLQQPWTCDTGETVDPILEAYSGDGSGLPRCESCDWCVSSRRDPVVMYADPVARQR